MAGERLNEMIAEAEAASENPPESEGLASIEDYRQLQRDLDSMSSELQRVTRENMELYSALSAANGRISSMGTRLDELASRFDRRFPEPMGGCRKCGRQVRLASGPHTRRCPYCSTPNPLDKAGGVG